MSNVLIQALGWTLLHSVWQIGLIGLFTLGLERLLRPYPAQLRHNLLLLLLGGMVLVSALTLWEEWRYFASIPQFTATSHTLQTTAGMALNDLEFREQSPIQTPASLFLRSKIWLETHLSFLVWCWALGIAVFSLRLVWNYLALARLRRNSIQIKDAQLDHLLHKVASAIGLRRQVSLRLSTQVQSPLTFGFFVPIVLFPVALIAQTPPALLEALLRHELIHIRRADFLINLGLAFLQILFFYHPLIWVITSRVQELREEACDAEVLDSGCNNLLYAEALLQLQKLNHHQNIPLVMQAQNPSSHFAMRLRQIMLRSGQAPIRQYSLSRALSGMVLLLLLLTGFSLGSIAATKQINVARILPLPNMKKSPNARRPDYKRSSQNKATLFIPKPNPALVPQKHKATNSNISSVSSPAPKDTTPVKPAEHTLKIATFRDKTLFLGDLNPITVSITGFIPEQIKLHSTDVEITALEKGKFNAKATRIGKAVIIVETPTLRWEIEFNVVYPDPIATLGNADFIGGELNVSALRQLKGIDPKLPPNFPEVKCEILGFNLIYVLPQKDPILQINPGGLFGPKVLEIVQQADANSYFILDNIRAKCPGDETGRKINNIAVKVVADPPKE